jgi:hypothetical protein
MEASAASTLSLYTVVSLLYSNRPFTASRRGVIVVVKATVSAKYVTLWSPQQIHMGDGLTNVTPFREAPPAAKS